MELRNIRTFHWIAELGSFTKAADIQGYTQAAVTLQIRQLEDELGVKLFERIGKSIRLTQSGLIFLDYANDMLKSEQEAMNAVKGDSGIVRGSLKIGSSESMEKHLLPDVIDELNKTYPYVKIQVETVSVTEMIKMTMTNQIDLLFFMDVPHFDDQLIRAFSRPAGIHFVASPRHKLAGRSNLSLEEVLSFPHALTEQGLSYRAELDRYADSLSLKADPAVVSDNTSLLMELIMRNSLVGYLPDYVTDQSFKDGSLVRLDLSIPTDMNIQLLHHRNKILTPQIKAFIAILNKAMPT